MRITKALPADARRMQRRAATARDDTTTGHRRKIIVGALLTTCILSVVVGGEKVHGKCSSVYGKSVTFTSQHVEKANKHDQKYDLPRDTHPSNVCLDINSNIFVINYYYKRLYPGVP